jgi:hypothetical protein
MEDNHPLYQWQNEGEECNICHGTGYIVVPIYDEEEQAWYNDTTAELCVCKNKNDEYDNQTDDSESDDMSEPEM